MRANFVLFILVAGVSCGQTARAADTFVSLEHYHWNDPQCPSGSHCSDGIRLRARDNGTLYFAAVDGMVENDARDVSFRKLAGRSDSSCVSFESFKYPGRFIRHSGTQVALSGGGIFDFNFNGDSTFCLRAIGQYESHNAPGFFLRKSGASLVLARLNDDKDAWWQTVFFEREFGTLGLGVFYAHGWQTDGDDEVVEVNGACTGIRPFWQSPSVTCTVPWPISDRPPWEPNKTRVVYACTASTPWIGTLPWFKMRRRTGGYFYWIETGRNVCYW